VSTPPPGPGSNPTATPESSAVANVLPFDSSLLFVLDDSISSSGSKAGDMVRVHLKDAITVGGTLVAPAGAPSRIRILSAQGAKAGDVYGYVDIYFMPLVLSDGKQIPLRTPTSHLTVNVSAGHEATVNTEDTVGDIMIPYHMLFRIFRKGRNVTLGAGAIVRARTIATLSVNAAGAISVQTPSPMALPKSTPASYYPTMPFATVPPIVLPNAKPTPYVVPSPTPYDIPSGSPAPAPYPTRTPFIAPSPTPYSAPTPTPRQTS
jgi:hypothetical protein